LLKNHYFYGDYFTCMNILIVSATEYEIRPLLNYLQHIKAGNGKTGHYMLDKLDIEVVITGIGMVNTAFHLGKAVSRKKFEFAVNAGIAGAYDTSVELGQVVNVTRENIAEFGTAEGDRFLSFFDTGLIDPDAFPFRSGYLLNEKWPDIPAIRVLPCLAGNTVNQIKTEQKKIAAWKDHYPADAETMERAAFLYGCLFEGIPCVQIRSVSNHVQDNDKSLLQTELAIENLNKTLKKILEELCI